MRKIVKNIIKCTHCGEIIESTNVHDFKFCSCGSVAIDGGHDYLRRCFKTSQDDFEELSEYIDVEDDTSIR